MVPTMPTASMVPTMPTASMVPTMPTASTVSTVSTVAAAVTVPIVALAIITVLVIIGVLVLIHRKKRPPVEKDMPLSVQTEGEPLSDDIPIERSPVYSAGPQSPTAATGGDGQEKKNEEREPDD